MHYAIRQLAGAFLPVHFDFDRIQPFRKGGRQYAGIAFGVDGERSSVEHEFILSADQVNVNDRKTPAPATFCQQGFSIFSFIYMKWRCVDIYQQIGAGIAGLQYGVFLPQVLADRERHPGAEQFHQAGAAAGTEITLLVEDLVVGQLLLVISRDPPALVNDRQGVEHSFIGGLRKSDRYRAFDAGLGNLRERPVDPLRKTRAQEQILGRIPGQAQFGKHDEIGIEFGSRLPGAFHDPPGIAVDIADEQIQLRHHDCCAHAIRSSKPCNSPNPD